VQRQKKRNLMYSYMLWLQLLVLAASAAAPPSASSASIEPRHMPSSTMPIWSWTAYTTLSPLNASSNNRTNRSWRWFLSFSPARSTNQRSIRKIKRAVLSVLKTSNLQPWFAKHLVNISSTIIASWSGLKLNLPSLIVPSVGLRLS